MLIIICLTPAVLTRQTTYEMLNLNPMKIKTYEVGPLQANCYLVWDEDSKLALVIDPGGSPKKIAGAIKEKGLTLSAIVHTHGHWDHTAGSDALQKLTGAPLFRHPDEPKSGMFHRARSADGIKVQDLADGQELKIGGLTFKVIHTPGHSPGSICLYAPGALFSGDLLFQGSVGRWDLKGGSFRGIVKSVNEGLAPIPDDTEVYPGHGPATLMGEERKTNPFFKSARNRVRGVSED